jgi:hypothetical protein
MVTDIGADFGDRAEPDAVRRVLRVFAKGFERGRVRHLETVLANFVADENDPAAFLGGFFDVRLHLLEVHVVEARAHGLRQIGDLWISGGFVQVAAPDNEALGNKRHVTPDVESTAHKFLAARIGKGAWLHSEQTLDFGVRAIELRSHHLQRVVFQRIRPRETVICGARMCPGVIADFVAIRDGPLPSVEPLPDVFCLQEKGGLDIVAIQKGQASVNLTDARIVEAQADGGALSVGPRERLRGSARGGQLPLLREDWPDDGTRE